MTYAPARKTLRRSTNLDGQTNCRAKSCEHIDQCVGTKEINTSPEQIGDARLRYAGVSWRQPAA